MDRLKRWGDAAMAMTAISGIIATLVAIFGGHLPPWATEAWAETMEQRTQSNSQAISVLTVIMLSDKVAAIQTALASNPGDQNLRASLLYWQQQLAIAQQATLSPRK